MRLGNPVQRCLLFVLPAFFMPRTHTHMRRHRNCRQTCCRWCAVELRRAQRSTTCWRGNVCVCILFEPHWKWIWIEHFAAAISLSRLLECRMLHRPTPRKTTFGKPPCTTQTFLAPKLVRNFPQMKNKHFPQLGGDVVFGGGGKWKPANQTTPTPTHP